MPPYTRYVNRPWGRRLAARSYVLGLTPDGVSYLSFAASALAVAILVLVTPSPLTGLTVALLLVLGYALDSADGQLARLLGTGGPAGEWLDHVIDQFRQSLLHAGVLIYVYRFVEGLDPVALLVPLLYGATVSTRFLSQILAEQLRRAASDREASAVGAHRGADRRAWIQLPSDPGVLCLAFAFAGWPWVFFWVYTALALANGVLAGASLLRRRGELKELST